MNYKKIEVAFEFLVFGIAIGIVEDLIAIKLITNEPITLKVIGIIVLIAIPFAILGEIIADNIDFIKVCRRLFGFPRTKEKMDKGDEQEINR